MVLSMILNKMFKNDEIDSSINDNIPNIPKKTLGPSRFWDVLPCNTVDGTTVTRATWRGTVGAR